MFSQVEKTLYILETADILLLNADADSELSVLDAIEKWKVKCVEPETNIIVKAW